MQHRNSVSTIAPEGVDDSRRFDVGDMSRILDMAIVESGAKAESIAAAAGITAAKLSDYRSGRRPLPSRVLSAIIQADRAVGICIVRELARVVGGLRVTEAAVDRAALRRRVLARLERDPAAMRRLIGEAARDIGADEQEALDVWHEPSVERRFG